jgi:chitin disaccharide deacetylase
MRSVTRFLIVNADDRRHPDLAPGLHLDLDGLDSEDRDQVSAECREQLEIFRALLGRNPTHLDSHHHVHESEPAKGATEALVAELGVPLRSRTIRCEGDFFGRDAISPEHLMELIRALPLGWTEIGCHPVVGPVPTSSYDAERRIELETLRDPRVKDLLNVSDVQPCSFAQANNR